MKILEFNDVSYKDGTKIILDQISLSVDQGDFISVSGSSGSGKTTFFRLAGNLISPAAGRISFLDKTMDRYAPTEWRKQIAYCFQTPVLFGDTVRDNMIFPFTIRNMKADPARILEVFQRFRMDGAYLDQPVTKLSGGEKQRLSLIRSLLFPPSVLLLDEATSALDPENTHLVEEQIRQLHQDGMTILWITHNPEQNQSYANKFLTFDSGKIQSLEVRK